jgi:hypothetical protein
MSDPTDVPEIAMYWTSAPPFIPQAQPSGSGAAPAGDVAIHSNIVVGLGTLRDAEQRVLEAFANVVTAYDNVKALYLSVKDYAYGQQATMETDVFEGSTAGFDQWQHETLASPIQEYARSFADGDGTQDNPGANLAQAETLTGIAGVAVTAGEFVVAVNNAGAAYGSADNASLFPAAK